VTRRARLRLASLASSAAHSTYRLTCSSLRSPVSFLARCACVCVRCFPACGALSPHDCSLRLAHLACFLPTYLQLAPLAPVSFLARCARVCVRYFPTCAPSPHDCSLRLAHLACFARLLLASLALTSPQRAIRPDLFVTGFFCSCSRVACASVATSIAQHLATLPCSMT
jgi:hypothetical protein